MPSVRYSFTLDALKDVDVIRWLDSQSNTSAAVREALKSYVEKPSNADLSLKLDEILNAIQTAQLVTPVEQPQPASSQAEPEIAVKGLKKMIQKFDR